MRMTPAPDDALLSALLASPAAQPEGESPLLISYLTLRKAVGLIGILLPFALAIGKLLLAGPGLQSSVSSYYYTVMRDVFVGGLCAIAVFLFTYRGYSATDDRAGNLAGLAALGVAVFPTTPEVDPTMGAQLIGAVHIASATVFFGTLAFFCLKLFTRTDRLEPTPEKLKRNLVYTVCGWTIVACLPLIAISWIVLGTGPLAALAPVFWLEALAIVAFGVSWLVKGEGLLKDKS